MVDASNVIRARLALESKDLELSQRAASELEQLGFDVVHIGPRGVGFEGSRELYEEAFKAKVRLTENGWRFDELPTIPEALPEGIASVYFPTKPEFI